MNKKYLDLLAKHHFWCLNINHVVLSVKLVFLVPKMKSCSVFFLTKLKLIWFLNLNHVLLVPKLVFLVLKPKSCSFVS